MYSKTRVDSHRCFSLLQFLGIASQSREQNIIGIVVLKLGDVWNEIEISIDRSVRNRSLENVKLESTRFKK